MQPFSVVIIDDHKHAREGIRYILQEDPYFYIAAEGESGAEAIALTEKYKPDIVLMDIHMPDMDGLEATRLIKSKHPYVKIIMVTVSDDVAHLFEAIKSGAQGYLLKNLEPDSWHEYLRAIALDEAPISTEIAWRLLQEFAPKNEQATIEHPLTKREQDVLTWVAGGSSNREIAQQLGISEHTVKNHLKNILHKLHLENRVQLTRYAFEHGWIKNE